MPYKFDEARRHKIPKAKYRMTNWPEYDAALVRRGSLTVWVTEEAIAAWHAPATGKPGGQPVYSDLAIETGLALCLVLSPGLRQVEGALGSIMQLLGVELRIPDHSTFSRRSGGLPLLSKPVGRDGPLHLLIDSCISRLTPAVMRSPPWN
jgi:Transposase DDE domain